MRGAVGKAKRSKTDRTGESDLEVMIDVGSSLPSLLLIENKITAQFQPMQAMRYRDRGSGRIEKGKIEAFRTVLLSPRAYFEGDLKGFDCRISFEEIRDFLSSTDLALSQLSESRRDYKIAVLNAAIARQKPAKSSVPLDTTEGYWKL